MTTTPTPASQPADLTDAEIVAVLASLGHDAEPSKYDWNPVLQVRTTVPAIRDIVKAYRAALAAKAQESAPSSNDVETDYTAWIKRRGALGPGAVPERIFFAGWSYGQRPTAGNAAPTCKECGATSSDYCKRVEKCTANNSATAAPGNAEILRAALLAAREMVGHPDNIAIIDKALADATAAPGDLPSYNKWSAEFIVKHRRAPTAKEAWEFLASNAGADIPEGWRDNVAKK